MEERKEQGRESRNNRRLWRLGTRDPRCSRCGERRPVALLLTADSIICYECRQSELDHPLIEGHHIAGRKNDRFKVPLSGNHHRYASDLQVDWPKKTFDNPHRSPVLRDAARLRGIKDLFYIAGDYFLTIASLLEELDHLQKQGSAPLNRGREIKENHRQ